MRREPEFDDAHAAAAWNAGADAWSEFIDSGADYYRHEVHGPALLDACEPLAGCRALDLGCGEGYFSRLLAGCGARVSAVDVAAALLQRARRLDESQPLGIEYRELSAAEIAEVWSAGSFDLVTACMSLHDVADVPRALKGANLVLRDGGAVTGEAGLMIRALREPRPTAEQVARHPQLDDCSRMPYFLIFELIKA